MIVNSFLNKYKEQYFNINLIVNGKIHDRFIVIEKNFIHYGAGVKSLNKCFAIRIIFDENVITILLRNL